ncbi:hypothetical protein EMIHUDRAFT_254208 [Emiliania huxleyi CCMP1516]|uniref:Uncharacterized protein n=2 Tax=Emiliania huxleyi TaxID=2903 RepID=A0A0D3JWT3_EMIH1|nr:hypothetical protein EMIHUDRAFT_254208 [Emiliania huxleyi CCMP1516]EOD27968.1 hypothetical protein EMIHUDRAFT_254208 [Emiliania huxleyi CCMP1516]|eukprot:XP_005780397.1 hypothetical protein EMIHUDRAFT_254208 [Emiliania huxleyi CCMP1516]
MPLSPHASSFTVCHATAVWRTTDKRCIWKRNPRRIAASRHADGLPRIGARLSGLSPEQLVAFIDEQAPLWSAAAMRVAEEHVARLVEQPEWVLSEVLLSPDLVPHILAQLPTKEHAAKGTRR